MRTLHRWEHQEPRRCGRPRRPTDVVKRAHSEVAAEWERQGKSAGWRPVHRALPELPKDLVQQGVREAKRRRRTEQRTHREAARISITVHGRDVLWGLDATHLGRLGKRAVEGQTLMDCGSSRTLGVSVGDPATSLDAVVLLEAVRRERRTLPLVLCCDNAPPYVATQLQSYAEARRMIVLHNRPRTPTDNARVERRQGEIKGESGLGKGVRLRDRLGPLLEVSEACQRLDHRRWRASLGYKTAVATDRAMTPGYDANDRERIYADACRRMRRAVSGTKTLRERRRAERAAVLELLDEETLITRHRSDGSSLNLKPDSIS